MQLDLLFYLFHAGENIDDELAVFTMKFFVTRKGYQ